MRDTDYRPGISAADPAYKAVFPYIHGEGRLNPPLFDADSLDLQPGDLELIDSFAELSRPRRRAVLESAGNMLSASMPRMAEDR